MTRPAAALPNGVGAAGYFPYMQSDLSPGVEVRRSKRRKRTVSAYRRDGKVIVMIPDRFTRAEEAEWVTTMLDRLAKSEKRRRRTDDVRRGDERRTEVESHLRGGLGPERDDLVVTVVERERVHSRRHPWDRADVGALA